MSDSQSNISNQINYKVVDQYAPRYKYVKINMSNILGNTVTITATGTTQVQFKMPYNSCYNLAKSKLVAVIPVGAQGASVYSFTVADAFPFGDQSLSFETGNGLQLLNLPAPAKYTKLLSKYNTDLKDFLTTDVSNIPHPMPLNNNLFLNASVTARPTDAPTIITQIFGTTTTSTTYNFATTGIPIVNNPTALATASSSIYEPQYFNISGANTANNIPVIYEFSNFKNTILGLDKDVYFGQNDLYFKFNVAGTNSWCYQGSTNSTPATAAATLSTAMTSLQNVYLYLAVEQNPIIIENIIKAYDTSGLRLLIDYPIVTQTMTAASTNQAIVIPFVPSMGKYLKRIYHSLFSGTQTLNTTLDCENNSSNAKCT